MGPVTVVTFHHTDIKNKKKQQLDHGLGEMHQLLLLMSLWFGHGLEKLSSEGTLGICLNQQRQRGQQGRGWFISVAHKHSNTFNYFVSSLKQRYVSLWRFCIGGLSPSPTQCVSIWQPGDEIEQSIIFIL